MTIKNAVKKICKMLGEKEIEKTQKLFQMHMFHPQEGWMLVKHTASWDEMIDYAINKLYLKNIETIWEKEATFKSQVSGYLFVIHAS